MKKLLKILIYFFVVIISAGCVAYILSRERLPEGESGVAADLLARDIETAVGQPSWRETAAVEFTFEARNNKHLYDYKRKLAEVRFYSGDDEITVQYHGKTWQRIVRKNNVVVLGYEENSLFLEAYKRHVNDMFWLNPFALLFAPGVVRKKVANNSLLVSFTSGGVTPGDSYLFEMNNEGLPLSFKMWVQIIPIQGIKATFENWIDTETGARVSTKHSTVFKDIELKNIKTYSEYPIAHETDRFLELLNKIRAESGDK